MKQILHVSLHLMIMNNEFPYDICFFFFMQGVAGLALMIGG